MNIESPLELLNLQERPEDKSFSFNPTSFEEYLGQQTVKEKLQVYTKACKMRGEALDHLLFFGPPGLGKTTLAHVMAKELGVDIKVTSGPVLERSGDLVAILSNLAEREILFIDEIHRLPKIVEESLYSAMENFCVDMIVGQGTGAKSMRLPLNQFTIIGATTKTSLLSGPLQTRFGIVERLDFYDSKDLAQIACQNAKFLEISITDSAAVTLGRRGRGTPRIIKRLLRRVRDFAQVNLPTTAGRATVSYAPKPLRRRSADRSNTLLIDDKVVNAALDFLGIDEDGLNKLDRDILSCIIKDFDGGPVGLETIAAMTGEDKDTLEFFCEPFLIRLGFLQKTPRGRQIPARKLLYLRKRLIGEDASFQNLLF